METRTRREGARRRQLTPSDETHFVFPLERPYDINHLTVFLTGESEPRSVAALTPVPFPEGYGATVHFAWPGGEYFLLGT